MEGLTPEAISHDINTFSTNNSTANWPLDLVIISSSQKDLMGQLSFSLWKHRENRLCLDCSFSRQGKLTKRTLELWNVITQLVFLSIDVIKVTGGWWLLLDYYIAHCLIPYMHASLKLWVHLSGCNYRCNCVQVKACLPVIKVHFTLSWFPQIFPDM